MSITVKTPNSSNITEYTYDAPTQKLEVLFKTGASYAYEAVPLTAFEDMNKAESVGSFFSKSIKNNYKCKALVPVIKSANVEEELAALKLKVADLEQKFASLSHTVSFIASTVIDTGNQ